MGPVPTQRNPVAKSSYNGWENHRANYTIPPFWLDDRPPLFRHVGVILRRFINISGYLGSESDEGDNAGEMSPGSNTESYPAIARIALRENPAKTSTCPDRESNPGQLVSRLDALSTGVVISVHYGASTVCSLAQFYPLDINCAAGVGGRNQRLRVFENKVLRKIFGAKRDEVTGKWRKLHNAELHALYSSPDIIRNIKPRRLRWTGHVARIGESRNAYRVLVGRPEGKRPLERPRRRWEDNIKMDLREVGYDDGDWINLAQYRDQWRAYVRAAMNLRVP
ncbi:hypothetical protein ANN_13464 [Periplaneta americana]|uniref:Uncharacterized protein n=1 Tax=Periplaneta americana TaxID=6978 RepID=A0ABQ8TL92_PERAM|nr:hypothetical protein ANN_13464 [Periplaneta americana]